MCFKQKYSDLVVIYSFNRKMNSRDFRVLFLYEWKNKHNAAAAARNINAAFGNGSVNECTILCWYEKLGVKVCMKYSPVFNVLMKTGDESRSNKDQGRSEIVVDKEVL